MKTLIYFLDMKISQISFASIAFVYNLGITNDNVQGINV